MYSARKDSLYCKADPDDSLHERILARVSNILCRLDIHDWPDWSRDRLFGGESRMCRNCTAQERRPES